MYILYQLNQSNNLLSVSDLITTVDKLQATSFLCVCVCVVCLYNLYDICGDVNNNEVQIMFSAN